MITTALYTTGGYTMHYTGAPDISVHAMKMPLYIEKNLKHILSAGAAGQGMITTAVGEYTTAPDT